MPEPTTPASSTDALDDGPSREDVILTADGTDAEAILTDDYFAVNLTTVHGRMAARAYAYSLAAEDPATARHILSRVGKEG